MIYLFDSTGVCVRAHSFSHADPDVKAEAIRRALEDSGASSFAESDAIHQLDTVYLHDGVLALRSARPTRDHVWDSAVLEWTLPLDKAKAQQWAVAKAQRDAAEFGPFTWNGYTFDGDEQSQRRLGLAVSAAQMAIAGDQPWSIDWTLEDNSIVTLSAADLIAVVEAMGANINLAHETARTRRAAIEAAMSLDELETISSNW